MFKSRFSSLALVAGAMAAVASVERVITQASIKVLGWRHTVNLKHAQASYSVAAKLEQAAAVAHQDAEKQMDEAQAIYEEQKRLQWVLAGSPSAPPEEKWPEVKIQTELVGSEDVHIQGTTTGHVQAGEPQATPKEYAA